MAMIEKWVSLFSLYCQWCTFLLWVCIPLWHKAMSQIRNRHLDQWNTKPQTKILQNNTAYSVTLFTKSYYTCLIKSFFNIHFWPLVSIFSTSHFFPFTHTALVAISRGVKSKFQSLALSVVFPILALESPSGPSDTVCPGQSLVPLLSPRPPPSGFLLWVSAHASAPFVCLCLSLCVGLFLSVCLWIFSLVVFPILLPSSFLLIFCCPDHLKKEQKSFLTCCLKYVLC